jgi:hypothetical protein
MHIQFASEDEERLREAALDLTMTVKEFILEAVETALQRNERDRLLNPTDPVELAETRRRMAFARRGF